jgi:hypothetical protein
MLEVLKRNWGDDARDRRYQVHIIGLRRLKLLNPHTTTTQNLATGIAIKEYYYHQKNPEGLKGISNHHWLAQQWIPACCIIT